VAHRRIRACGPLREDAMTTPDRVRSVYRILDRQELAMMDGVVLAIALGFFVLSIGYAYYCERL
jgi:hypothetical protein